MNLIPAQFKELFIIKIKLPLFIYTATDYKL